MSSAAPHTTIALFNPISGDWDTAAEGGEDVLTGAVDELRYRLEQIEELGAEDYRDAGMLGLVVTVNNGGNRLSPTALSSVGDLVRLGRKAGMTTLIVVPDLKDAVISEKVASE